MIAAGRWDGVVERYILYKDAAAVSAKGGVLAGVLVRGRCMVVDYYSAVGTIPVRYSIITVIYRTFPGTPYMY